MSTNFDEEILDLILQKIKEAKILKKSRDNAGEESSAQILNRNLHGISQSSKELDICQEKLRYLIKKYNITRSDI